MRLGTTSLAVAVVVLSAAALSMADIQPGDSWRDVLQTLGKPRGYIRSGEYVVFYYERGKVELQNGRVVSAKLISEEEAEERRLRREQEEEERRKAEEERREQLYIEGLGLMQRLLSDPDFLAASSSRQITIWREFMRRYPDVPVPEHYLEALRRREEELARKEQDLKMAELEARVREAERKAEEAEQEARDARSEWTYSGPVWVPTVHEQRRPCYGYDGVSLEYKSPKVTVRYGMPYRCGGPRYDDGFRIVATTDRNRRTSRPYGTAGIHFTF